MQKLHTLKVAMSYPAYLTLLLGLIVSQVTATPAIPRRDDVNRNVHDVISDVNSHVHDVIDDASSHLNDVMEEEVSDATNRNDRSTHDSSNSDDRHDSSMSQMAAYQHPAGTDALDDAAVIHDAVPPELAGFFFNETTLNKMYAGSASPPDQCYLPVAQGTGSSPSMRWHYNYEMDQCMSFVYYGNHGNDNNYRNIIECEQTCRQPLVRVGESRHADAEVDDPLGQNDCLPDERNDLSHCCRTCTQNYPGTTLPSQNGIRYIVTFKHNNQVQRQYIPMPRCSRAGHCEGSCSYEHGFINVYVSLHPTLVNSHTTRWERFWLPRYCKCTARPPQPVISSAPAPSLLTHTSVAAYTLVPFMYYCMTLG